MSTQYTGYNRFKKAMQKAFPGIANGWNTKELRFTLKFGYTTTDWQIEIRQDYQHHTLKLVDKSVFLDWLNEDDKKAYEAFKAWTLDYRLTIED